MNFPDPNNPLHYAVPIFLLLIVVELVYSLKREKHIYYWKDLVASTSVGTGAAIIAVGTKVVTLGFFYLVYELFNYEVAGVSYNVFGYKSLGWAWYIWLLCQLADDFSYYWFHRANHEIRFFWAAHVVHHSSEKFNLGTGVRTGWFTLLYKPLFYMWMPALGFHPIMVMTCLAIESIWQFQLHTKYVKNLGIFEKVMNSHSHHHVHHSSDIKNLDKNHGGFLNIFDRMFGTFKEWDKCEDTKYGVLHPPNSYNPMVIVTHEYKNMWQDVRRAKSWKHKLMYVFGPPGWSPDGSSKTVKEMQRELS